MHLLNQCQGAAVPCHPVSPVHVLCVPAVACANVTAVCLLKDMHAENYGSSCTPAPNSTPCEMDSGAIGTCWLGNCVGEQSTPCCPHAITVQKGPNISALFSFDNMYHDFLYQHQMHSALHSLGSYWRHLQVTSSAACHATTAAYA